MSGINDLSPVCADACTEMSDDEFKLFSTLICTRLGIKMPSNKKLMLVSRLSKRMKALACNTFSDYYNYLVTGPACDDEFNRMIESVTTNKTDFFREPNHFRIMRETVLPQLLSGERFRSRRSISAWSAGCSTGAEAYSIAMVMDDFFSEHNTGDFTILATDISQKVLKAGINAVYTEQEIEPVPLEMRKKYVLRGLDDNRGLFRMAPEIRKKIKFRQLNLMANDYSVVGDMDIIFCRNVIIYFDRKTQIELFGKIFNLLVPGGYLFIGSSETLYGINDMFISVGPTVYRKPIV